MKDLWGAMFRPDVVVSPLASGPLDGMTFAVKENIDVAGYVTAAGNPDWLRTHEAAQRHADIVTLLLEAGAKLTGKTHTDELMYSLNGENVHYGTPVNPRAPGHVPGGSSSGSAVAVAAGLTDFALGTDTGGSIRVPSSYCGIYGIRPTHGRVSMAGVLKLAPSFCTVGWMARTADVLARVGDVVFGSPASVRPRFNRCIVATDVLSLVELPVREKFLESVAIFHHEFEEMTFEPVAPEGLSVWMWAFRILQGREIWKTHGNWIETVQPKFGPDIAERFTWTRSLTGEMEAFARSLRESARRRMELLLDENTVLLMPTTPGGAPELQSDARTLAAWRARLLQLTCIAGLAGLPEVSVPWVVVDGLPVGISVIGARNQDERILHWISQWSGKYFGSRSAV